MPAQSKEYGVYFLRDPRDGIVRYIGMTASPRLRANTHWSSRLTRYDYEPKRIWLQELDSLGLRPFMDLIITGLSCWQAASVERRLIFLHSQVRGVALLQKPMNVKPSGINIGYKLKRDRRPLLLDIEPGTNRLVGIRRGSVRVAEHQGDSGEKRPTTAER